MNFDCLAYNEETAGGELKGYNVSATINFETGESSWGLGEE